MQRRPSLGPATFYVATLVVVLVAVALFAVARSQQRPARSLAPTTAPGALSPLDEALQGINNDGTWSKETALKVFAAAFGPLPDVPTPRPDSSYRSGSLAIRMVQAYWSELTDPQKAAINDYIGPAAAASMPAAAAPRPAAPVAVAAAFHPDASDHPELEALKDDYQKIVDADIADVSTAFGRPLGIPIPVIIGGSENGDAWAWNTGEWPIGQRASGCTMTVPPSTVNDPTRQPFLRWVFMHEVWHCFEYQMITYLALKASPPWVIEGSANWVAEALTKGEGAPPPALEEWRQYITDPGKQLYARSYDGMGFFAQLAKNGIDPWKVLEPVVRAGTNDGAFQASGANAASFADSWGSSWFRDSKPSTSWAMTASFGIPGLDVRATPSPIKITNGVEDTISAKPNSGAIAAIDTTAFVTRFEVSGAGRVADPASAALDKILRAGTLDLCTNPSGDCTCPPGSADPVTPPDRAPGTLRGEVTGEQHNLSVMNIRGISKDDWCKTSLTPPPGQGSPCKDGCGGSNGDPHLRTIDGVRYDLQSVGEYVLLRAADGSVEVQGRQERLESGGSATIGTAVAVKVNSHKVGFYMAAGGVPEVRLDGAVVEASKVGSADLGTGATLTGYPKGYELDLPDGTKVWALSIGHWGINLLVRPSASLRSSGVGLIAAIPLNAGYRVPAMPDGSVFKVPLDRHEKYHDLYEVLAPAWRVTTATSLFDYAAGTTTDTFTLKGFPPETVPQTTADLDPAAVATARTACAAVTDPELADQCAYDTTVTGSTEYVTLYTVTDTFQTQGTTALGPPTSGPTPSPPPAGGPSAGIKIVEDHLAAIGSAVLGPDGTLYVTVGEQAAAFGDVSPFVLAVNSSTGAIKRKVPSVAIGWLAWAAGSLWAGEFNRSDAAFCEISRLDPVTLTVQAQVPTVCNSVTGRTAFATVGDAIWFIDPTGADANGTGAHLRRIDPATNKVDAGTGGNLDLPVIPLGLGVPVTNALFASTSDGLIVGDRHSGVYRLSAGSDAFEQIQLPATAATLFPAGAGIWTQTEIGTSGAPEGVVTFASGDPGSDVQLPITGYLVGAEDTAVYVTPPIDDGQLDELYRYPTDGGTPTRIATSGTVPSGFGGTLILKYDDPLFPFLIRDRLMVKLWQAASSNENTQLVLAFQAIALP